VRVRDNKAVPIANIEAMASLATELEKLRKTGEIRKEADVWTIVQQMTHVGATESTDPIKALTTFRDVRTRRNNMKKNLDELLARLEASKGDLHAHALYDFCMDQAGLIERTYADLIREAVKPGAQIGNPALFFTKKGITNWFLNTMFTDTEQQWVGKTTIHECLMGNSPMMFKREDIPHIPEQIRKLFCLIHFEAKEYMTPEELKKWSSEHSEQGQKDFNNALPLIVIDPRVAEKVKEFTPERAIKYSSFGNKIKPYAGSIRLEHVLNLLVRRMIIGRFGTYDEEIQDLVKIHNFKIPDGVDIAVTTAAKKLFQENPEMVKKLFAFTLAPSPAVTTVTVANEFELNYKNGLQSSSAEQKEVILKTVKRLLENLDAKLVVGKSKAVPAPHMPIEIPMADKVGTPVNLRTKILARTKKKIASHVYPDAKNKAGGMLSDEALHLIGTVNDPELQEIAVSFALAKMDPIADQESPE
jgi:hypothetical protein